MEVVCDTAKVRVFKQITTGKGTASGSGELFAILQKYEFSSKSQPKVIKVTKVTSCLRYCKSTSFQANHNKLRVNPIDHAVVCDTAKVRVFKQITTYGISVASKKRCLRYCKSTSFQANHNTLCCLPLGRQVVCDTAKVRVFKQITTPYSS